MDTRTRLLVIERDEGTCQECGGPGQEIHHVVPKRMGGRHGEAKKRSESIDNLQLLCVKCHRGKHG